MSSKKKDLAKSSKIKLGKTEKIEEVKSEIITSRKPKSTYSPKSTLKIPSKTGFPKMPRISPHQQVAPLSNNPNESTYGTLPEAKGYSKSIYKKAVSPQAGEQVAKDHEAKQVDQQTLTHATYYLSTKGYRVLEKVGSGNYAKVYRVINPENKELAVKIIDLNKTSQNYRVKFLPRELDILSRLHHRNIAKIFEIIQLPKLIYIFMEYTPNGTVADFLRVYRAIPENFCQVMFHRIIDALHYLHKANIAHRDLKVLENILIDKHGQPKLTDFSYSLICKADKMNKILLSQTFCGSLPYISPEILQENPYDPKIADIWSLGICLYVMLNDGLPFKFNDIPYMLKCQLTKNWKFKNRVVNKLSDEVKDLVKQMLEPDVKLRIDAYSILQHPWIKSN